SSKLAKPFEKFGKYFECAPAIKDMMDMASNRQQALAYWESAKDWWSEWEKMEREEQVDMHRIGEILLLNNPRSIGQSIGYTYAKGNKNDFIRRLGMLARSGRACPDWTESMLSAFVALMPRVKEKYPKLFTVMMHIAEKSRAPKLAYEPHMGLTMLLLGE